MQLGTARKRLGQKGRDWTESRNSALVESLDSNKDGRISSSEFVKGFSAKMPDDIYDCSQVLVEFQAVARWVRAKSKGGRR